MLDEIYKDTKSHMNATVKSFSSDLAKVRTGRASLSIFDGVKVDYYGQPTPLNQVAGVAIPEPNLITIQPWETSILPDIEKAILAANLGMTPNSDGQMLRISVPPLTEERRKEYAKRVSALAETAKTAIRNQRRDQNDKIKKLEKDKEISQDQMHDGFDVIQKATDKAIGSIDDLSSAKEKEIMEI